MALKFYNHIRKSSYLLILFLSITSISWAKVIYVAPVAAGLNNGTSWANAYGNLQTAIYNAVVGDSLWVKEGTYIPTIHVTNSSSNDLKFFGLNKNIKIFGGFKGDETSFDQRDWVNNKTILSGDINKNNSSNSNYTTTANRTDDVRRIFVAIGSLVDAVVDGFYMKNSYSTSSVSQSWNSVALKSDFHGVLINNCTGLTLRNLDISFMYSGGMTGLNIYQSTINLENIQIHQIYSIYSNNNINASKVIAKNIFVNNSSSKNSTSGIAFYADKKSSIENLKIINTSSPSWGVLDIFNCDTVKINRLELSFNNTRTMAALSIERSKAIISNALIANNQTTSISTAMTITNTNDAASKSYIKLVNATITKNTSSAASTKYVFSASYDNQIDLRNSIIMNPTLYFNKIKFSYLFNNYLSGNVSATYSSNNIVSYQDPFLDSANNNFQLQIGSLARNGGDSTMLIQALGVNNLNNQLDVYGNPRVNQAGKIDIGAVEDTLIDALLSRFKVQFNYDYKEQTLLTKVENNTFEQLIIKGGKDAQSLTTWKYYQVDQQKKWEDQFIVFDASATYFELWGRDINGRETLLAIQNKKHSYNPIKIQVSPNPATQLLNVQLPISNIRTIQIFDISGRLAKVITPNHTVQQQINIADLTPGTYYLVVQSDEEKQSIPFIKK